MRKRAQTLKIENGCVCGEKGRVVTSKTEQMVIVKYDSTGKEWWQMYKKF